MSSLFKTKCACKILLLDLIHHCLLLVYFQIFGKWWIFFGNDKILLKKTNSNNKCRCVLTQIKQATFFYHFEDYLQLPPNSVDNLKFTDFIFCSKVVINSSSKIIMMYLSLNVLRVNQNWSTSECCFSFTDTVVQMTEDYNVYNII